MNYLALVNKAIQEAGVDLDDLTSSNFANPSPTKMYTRFKNWVADAWKDIVKDNTEWEFGKGTAVISIYPRILVSVGDRASGAPPVDSEFTSDSGGVSFSVVDSTLLSGTWEGGDAEAFLDIVDPTGGPWIMLEDYDETSPSASTGVFKYKYFGRYSLQDEVDDLEEANYQDFQLQDPETGASFGPLKFISWNDWQRSYETYHGEWGVPEFFTETPEGYLDFYPRPSKQYTLAFEYTKSTPELTDYDDEPTGLPERYHDAIVWLAIKYYADFDENSRLWSKADKRYWRNILAMDRDLGQLPTFGRCLYDE
jgi:hypothetical protein